MASNIGNLAVQMGINQLLGQTAPSAMASVYLALFTTTPTSLTAGTGGTEVSTNNYARCTVTNNTTNWPVISSTTRVKTNGADFTFATPSGSWGTVVGWGIYDAITTGNWLLGGTLTAPVAIGDGSTNKFVAGAITITFA